MSDSDVAPKMLRLEPMCFQDTEPSLAELPLGAVVVAGHFGNPLQTYKLEGGEASRLVSGEEKSNGCLLALIGSATSFDRSDERFYPVVRISHDLSRVDRQLMWISDRQEERFKPRFGLASLQLTEDSIQEICGYVGFGETAV